MKEIAERYAALGWALVELEGKSPRGYGWQRSLPLPPKETGEIWATRTGNMGLVLGPSGVIDYEMDAGSEEEFLAPLAWKIPDTPAFRTGTGKLHILFRDPGGLTRRTRDGFELRAGPHQSVIPPSVHPDTGKPYEWINSPFEYELLDPPQKLLEYFADTDGKGSDVHWSSPLRGQRLGPGEGRHASMISFLGKMVDVLETPEQLVSAALTYADLTQDPPYPEETITDQALDVWRRYRVDPDVEVLEDALGIRSLDKVKMRSIEWAWKPFLQRSAFHLLVGRKGAGKGSLLAWISAQVTSGTLGEDETPKAVLWISTEDSFEVDVKPRFVAQGGNQRLMLTATKRVRLPQDIERIEAVCREHMVGLVVIDPIIGVIGAANTNDEGAIVSAIGGLNDLADRLDLSVIGVRHLGKSLDRGILESVLGSAAWVNTPRVVLGIAQDEEDKDVTLQVLAGNRSRSRSSFQFRLEEYTVKDLKEPVSKIVPVGPSYRDVTDVLTKEPPDTKFELVRDYVVESLRDGTPIQKDQLLQEVVEKFDARDRTLRRVLRELKESGALKWIAPAKDANGQFVAGGHWYVVKAR